MSRSLYIIARPGCAPAIWFDAAAGTAVRAAGL